MDGHYQTVDEQIQNQQNTCKHKWIWSLSSGELWAQPENMDAYDSDLIRGWCSKCGVTHKPAKAPSEKAEARRVSVPHETNKTL